MGGRRKPLLVFDCDYTLWPFDCGKEVTPPFINYCDGNRIIDRYYIPANPYPEVISVFEYIYDHGIPFAIASRNPASDWIKQLLQKIKVRDTTIWDMIPVGCFHAYSSGWTKAKSRHLARISEATDVDYTDMIFFDDVIENINEAVSKGVICVHVGRHGLTMEAFRIGYEYWIWRERQPQPQPQQQGLLPQPENQKSEMRKRRIKVEFSATDEIIPQNTSNEVQASDPAP